MKMEGNIEINKDLIDAFRRIIDYKEGVLLTNAMKQAQVEIDRYQYEYYCLDENNLNVDQLIKSQLIEAISKLVFKDMENLIESSESLTGNKIYKIKFLSMPVDNFKKIVEYCVRTMPMESINKIRENK